MKYPADIKKKHEEIQKKIFYMLPEKWDRLYLYASVMEYPGDIKMGEMFFYYFPKGILRKRPVNVYEIPSKFDIDERQYAKYADELYDTIKNLREICIENGEEPWSNITISIENLKYRATYNYEDLTFGELDEDKRRVIWLYRYLKLPYASFTRKEKALIDRYEKQTKPRETSFELPLYTKGLNKNMETISDMQKKFKFVTEDKMEEIEFSKKHVPKSQILK